MLYSPAPRLLSRQDHGTQPGRELPLRSCQAKQQAHCGTKS